MPSSQDLTRRSSMSALQSWVRDQPEDIVGSYLAEFDYGGNSYGTDFNDIPNSLSSQDTAVDDDFVVSLAHPALRSAQDPFVTSFEEIVLPDVYENWHAITENGDDFVTSPYTDTYPPYFSTNNAFRLVPEFMDDEYMDEPESEPMVAPCPVASDIAVVAASPLPFDLQELHASLPAERSTCSTRSTPSFWNGSTPLHAPSDLDSDDIEDFDEDDEEEDDEDEYVPAPRATRHQGSRTAAKKGRARPSRLAAPAKRVRSSVSRNVQATEGIGMPAPCDPGTGEPVKASRRRRGTKVDWTCPHCGKLQANRRGPDLKRHIKTHFKGLNPWVCNGVPAEEAALYGLTNRKPKLIDGVWMVGGCGRDFSRRDALKRHCDNHNLACVGDPRRPYMRAMSV